MPDVLSPAEWCITHALGVTGTLVSDLAFISLDFETSGLRPDQAHIVEVSARKFTVAHGQLCHFETLVQSPSGVGPTHVHRITADALVGAPTQQQVAQVLANILCDGVVLAHNAEFEQGFLATLFQQTGTVPPGQINFCDTLAVARQHIRGLPNHRLASVHEHVLGRPIVGAHSAAGDTLAVLDLWRAICNQVPQLALPVPGQPMVFDVWPDDPDVKPRR